MVQLKVVSDGTREGTHVLLPDGTPITGVIGIDYSQASDGEPVVSVHLVGTKVHVNVEPEFLEGVAAATMDELLAKQRQIATEIKKRNQEESRDAVINAPVMNPGSTVASEARQTSRSVVDMISPEPPPWEVGQPAAQE
jgi:hypothetical protein